MIRAIVVVGIAATAWIVLKRYAPDEIDAVALRFWSWWTGLVSGPYAEFWNPNGAAIALLVIALIVLRPFRSRRVEYAQHDGTDDDGVIDSEGSDADPNDGGGD